MRTTTRPPLRVLIACDHIDHQGALHGGGRQLIELTRALQGTQIEATVCILRGESDTGRRLRAEGLPFIFFGAHRFSPFPLARLVRLIRARNIDVLHLTDFGACTLGRIAGWLTRTPAIVQVITHHSEFQPRGFPRYVELAYRALAPFTARALAISASVKEFAVGRMGFAPEQVEVLHYPFPRHSFSAPTPGDVARVRRQYGIGDGDPVIGAVTRFHRVKGMDYLVEAFARVVRSFPTAWLVLVGQGPDEAELRERCMRLGVEKRVIFAGFQPGVQAYVGTFWVSAVPSLEEGFGLVALEAQALGVPVVASAVGGLPEIVSDGKTGLLVQPANAGLLAAAIERLLGDPELRRRMGAEARGTAQRFSLDHYANRLSEIYGELAPAAAGNEAPQATSLARQAEA